MVGLDPGALLSLVSPGEVRIESLELSLPGGGRGVLSKNQEGHGAFVSVVDEVVGLHGVDEELGDVLVRVTSWHVHHQQQSLGLRQELRQSFIRVEHLTSPQPHIHVLGPLVRLQRYLVLLRKRIFALHQPFLLRFLFEEVGLEERVGPGVIDLEGGQKGDLELRNLLGSEDDEGAGELFIDLHKTAMVLEHATVVWGTEDGNAFAIGEELVAIVDHHVASAD